MKTRWMFGSLLGFLVGCGQGSVDDPDAGTNPGGDPTAETEGNTPTPGDPVTNGEDEFDDPVTPETTPPPFGCYSGNTVTTGWNQWMLQGVPRNFWIDAPGVSDDTPVAVIFSFHGYGDTMENWRGVYAFGPDADEAFPFVLVTPDDTGLTPLSSPTGLDWEFMQSHTGDQNREAALFEEVLGCLAAQRTVDGSRIYTVGFSAGAITANMLHARYSDTVAAVVAFSGAWFNDPQQAALISMPTMTVNWDAMPPGGAAVLLSHGGANDRYAPGGYEILNFERAAQAAIPFLINHGRVVLDCPHARGHTNHPSIYGTDVLDFFKDHRVGDPSPYVDGGGSARLRSTCTVRLP